MPFSLDHCPSFCAVLFFLFVKLPFSLLFMLAKGFLTPFFFHWTEEGAFYVSILHVPALLPRDALLFFPFLT